MDWFLYDRELRHEKVLQENNYFVFLKFYIDAYAKEAET